MLVSSRITSTSTNTMAATNARQKAACHVGGTIAPVDALLLSRASARASPLFSAAVGLRPVRPRDSITPAALPRCLVWRLRLVWAMGLEA